MKTLATLFRHVVTYLVGLLVAFLTVNLSGVELQSGVDAANALVEPLVILLGLLAVIASRLAMPFFNRIFRVGSGDDERNDGPSGGMGPIMVTIGTAAALFGSLPSCSPGEFPVRLGVEGPGYAADYSSKSGLSIRAVVVRREK